MTTPNKVTAIGTTTKGAIVWCRRNEAGGVTYTTNEIGGGVVVWNTALVSREAIAMALDHARSAG